MQTINILDRLHSKKLINFRKVVPSENKFLKDLSLEINSSYLTVCSKTNQDRFLGKYQEIPFSDSCLLGNTPSRYRHLLDGNMVEVNSQMTDSEIIKIILDSLKDKTEILKKTERLHKKFLEMLNYDKGTIRFEEIIDSCLKK